MQLNRRTWPLAVILRHAGPLRKVRGWDRVLRFLFSPDKQKPFEFSVPFFGLSYFGTADSFIDWSVLFYGAYEHDLLKFASGFLKEIDQPVIFDIGANVGHHSLFFASHAGAVVHAFEPSPLLWPAFQRLMTANKVDNRVLLHKCGLGAINAELTFHVPTGANRGTGSFKTDREIGISEILALPVRRGDDYVAEHGITNINLIKIDVEGFEKDVLAGISETVAKARPIIWIEISGPEAEQTASLAALGKILSGPYEFRIAERKGHIFNSTEFRVIPKLPEKGGFNLFCLPK